MKSLDIDWKSYDLIKSSSNYPALQQSISGIYKVADKLFLGSLIFAGVVLSLLLLLWINARKKEIGIMLALGITKAKIMGQFIMELMIIGSFAFAGSFFLASYTGKTIANKVLAKKMASDASSANLGAGVEVDGFNKTLTSLNININSLDMVYVVIFGVGIMLIALLIASNKMLRKHPKELLTDIE